MKYPKHSTLTGQQGIGCHWQTTCDSEPRLCRNVNRIEDEMAGYVEMMMT